METILGLIGIVVVWALFNFALKAGVGTVRAAARTAMGKGTFTDNFNAAVVGMGPMEARIFDTKLSDEPDSLAVKEIQVKGLFAVTKKYRIAFSTSLFDETSGTLVPVVSNLEAFQEQNTRAYRHLNDVGAVEPGIGLISWVRVGVVIPEIIETPYSGPRQLLVVLRLIDLDNEPQIDQGFHRTDDKGILWQRSLKFDYVVKQKGYLEAVELRDKARLLCVQIGMAIAMWNGPLGDSEASTLKGWVEKLLSGRSGEKRESLKDALNDAMKTAYEKARQGELSLGQLTDQLNEVDDDASKYEAVELCFDILASSTIDNSDKARVIDLVAKSLNLNPKEVERIRDIKIVGLNADLSRQMRVEDLLGIDENWDAEQTKRHLRIEFQKWNNRLMTLPEGGERNNAQRMLDAISEARKKYA